MSRDWMNSTKRHRHGEGLPHTTGAKSGARVRTGAGVGVGAGAGEAGPAPVPYRPSRWPDGPRGLVRQEARRAWMLLVPTIIIVVGVALYPLFETVRLSFTDARLGSSRAAEYIGLLNYQELLSDFAFLDAIGNTIYFTVVSVGAELVLGMVVALVIHSHFRGRGLMRTAVLVPWAIPTVVSAQMWRWMYNDVFGVLNDILMRLHIIAQPVAWMAIPGVAMHAIIAVDVWKTTPFMALLLLAGLQVIPGELYEAARVDGAGAVRRFFLVTLPLLKPAILVALIFRTLDALRVFDVIFVMTAGASGTETMATYARRILIQFQQLGYGSSISVIIFLIIAVFTVFYRKALGAERE